MLLRRGFALLILVIVLAAFPVFWAYTTDVLDTQRLANAAGVAQIMGLVGLVLAVPQLWFLVREQRRIAEDLARRPDIHIGFTRGRIEKGQMVEAPSRVLAVIASFQDQAEYSQYFQGRIILLNAGMRSARDVVFNLRHNDDMSVVQLNQSAFVDEDGVKILPLTTPFIHPLDYYFVELLIGVRRGVRSVEFTCTITMSDDAERIYPLRLIVSVQ